MPVRNWIVRTLIQIRSLLWKNGKQAIKNWKSTMILVIAPVFFCLLCFLLQLWYNILQSREGTLAVIVGNVSSALVAHTPVVSADPWNGATCITLAYAPPGVQWVDDIIQSIATENQLDLFLDVQVYQSLGSLQNYTLLHPNLTQAAVIFSPDMLNNFTIPSEVKYTLMVNISTGEFDVSPHVQRAVDAAILRVAGNGTGAVPKISLSYGGYPVVRRRNVSHGDIVAATGSLWFYSSAMFPFIQLLQHLVGEKELKLRNSMYVSGLSRTAYWTSWLLSAVVINLLQSLILIASGAAFGFEMFTNVNFGVLLLVFVAFAVSMAPLAMLVSVFLSSVRTANTVAFVFFIVGFLLQSFLSSFGVTLLYDPSTTPIPKEVFVFYPPFNFAKALSDVSQKAYPTFDSNLGKYVLGPGYFWSDLYEPIVYPLGDFTAPATIWSIGWLGINLLIFGCLSWYLDNVLPNQGGVRKPFYFLLSPAYWGLRRHDRAGYVPMSLDVDEDLSAEAERAANESVDVPLRVVGLRKVYKAPLTCRRPALRGLFMVAEDNGVLCLLGHNGAGKTTAINILTGGDDADSGDAFIFGLSVATQMDQIRSLIGVCPQHDVLWEELSACDHLRLFGGLRGMTGDTLSKAVEAALAEVNLTTVGDKAAGTFSGGMKRRLSVAVACIGNPRLIFLDEPTTGLDPVSRREVWEVVQRLKQGRCLVLTTHNMEEADVLADRVAIIAAGLLRCVGNSLHLKAKYGDGYRITLVTDPDLAEDVVRSVLRLSPSAKCDSNTAGSLSFTIPLSNIDEMPALFMAVEQGKIPGVRDWGLSHTTLEDVFLKVTLGHSEGPSAYALPQKPVLARSYSVNAE